MPIGYLLKTTVLAGKKGEKSCVRRSTCVSPLTRSNRERIKRSPTHQDQKGNRLFRFVCREELGAPCLVSETWAGNSIRARSSTSHCRSRQLHPTRLRQQQRHTSRRCERHRTRPKR